MLSYHFKIYKYNILEDPFSRTEQISQTVYVPRFKNYNNHN